MIGVDIMSIKITVNGAILLADNTMQQVQGVYEREDKIEGSHEQIVSAVSGLDVKTFWGSVTQVAVTYTLDWAKIRELLADQVKQLVDSQPNASEFYKTSGGNTSVTNGSKGGSYADRATKGYYDTYKITEDGKIVFGKLGEYPNITTSEIVQQAISTGSVQKPALINALKSKFASQE